MQLDSHLVVLVRVTAISPAPSLLVREQRREFDQWHNVQDLNNNGIREASEPPLSNWSVYIDSDRNQQLNAGEPTTTTASDGSYTFGGVVFRSVCDWRSLAIAVGTNGSQRG